MFDARSRTTAHGRAVLVLGDDTRAFLAAVRSLGRAGYIVDAAFCPADEPAARSRYLRRRLEVPPYRHGDASWAERFAEQVTLGGYALVLPCTDPADTAVRAIRGKVPAACRLALIDDRARELAASKVDSYELARSLGIPVARGRRVTSRAELAHALQALCAPWVLKPLRSFDDHDVAQQHFVHSARRWDEAMGLGEAMLRASGVIHVQEHFAGFGVGVELLCEDGEALMSFQHLRVHEPVGHGSTYRRGMPLHSGMYDAACRLMLALKYTGVAMVEYRWDPEDNRWIFIEINARLWGSLPLAVASGADFPAALAELLLDGQRPGAKPVRTDLYARNLATDYAWWRALRRGGEPPTLPPRDLAVDGLRPLLHGCERWDTFSADDPAPWMAELDKLGRNLLRAAGRRLIGSVARTLSS